MQKVSKAYKESMKSSLRERAYIMISFGLVNQEAQAKATVDNGSYAYYSNKDYFYADEINALEANLVTINTHSLKRSYGTAPTYAANGNTMDFKELNRLEGAILDLYDRLTNESEGRRTFTWNFGMKGGL